MSRTFVVVFLAFAAFAALYLSSCSEPTPGEVGGQITRNGQPFGGTVNVLNANGDIVSAEQSIAGVYFVRNIPPGIYTVQVVDAQGNVLATEENVEVEADGSTNLNFDF